MVINFKMVDWRIQVLLTVCGCFHSSPIILKENTSSKKALASNIHVAIHLVSFASHVDKERKKEIRKIFGISKMHYSFLMYA